MLARFWPLSKLVYLFVTYSSSFTKKVCIHNRMTNKNHDLLFPVCLKRRFSIPPFISNIWNSEQDRKNGGSSFSGKYEALIFVLKMFALRISTFRVEQRMSDADIVALHPITRSAGWGRDSFSLPASPACHVALPLIAQYLSRFLFYLYIMTPFRNCFSSTIHLKIKVGENRQTIFIVIVRT